MFNEGSPFHTSVLPVGGNFVTNDVAIGIKTSLPVADTQRWLDAVSDAVVSRDRLRLTFNRVCRDNKLDARNVETALGVTAWARVPNDFERVSSAANRGIPCVVDSPDCAVSRSITGMAERLIAEAKGAGGAAVRAPDPSNVASRRQRLRSTLFGRLLGNLPARSSPE